MILRQIEKAFQMPATPCRWPEPSLKGPLGVLPSGWVRSQPEVLVRESDEDARFIVEAPGVSMDGVKVSIEGRLLGIALLRTLPERPGYRQVACERQSIDVTHRIELGPSLNPGDVSARLRDGLLVVRVSKCPVVQPRTIEIETQPPGAEEVAEEVEGGDSL